MNRVVITQESPITNEGRALIEGSEQALREAYSAEECFTFTADELAKDHIAFFVARKDQTPVGCVALVNEATYGEVKRLYVSQSARGLGVAKLLMQSLEDQALEHGQNIIKIETGDKLVAAVKLYQSLGYSQCQKFGDYPDHPASLFMEKSL